AKETTRKEPCLILRRHLPAPRERRRPRRPAARAPSTADSVRMPPLRLPERRNRHAVAPPRRPAGPSRSGPPAAAPSSAPAVKVPTALTAALVANAATPHP